MPRGTPGGPPGSPPVHPRGTPGGIQGCFVVSPIRANSVRVLEELVEGLGYVRRQLPLPPTLVLVLLVLGGCCVLGAGAGCRVLAAGCFCWVLVLGAGCWVLVLGAGCRC